MNHRNSLIINKECDNCMILREYFESIYILIYDLLVKYFYFPKNIKKSEKEILIGLYINKFQKIGLNKIQNFKISEIYNQKLEDFRNDIKKLINIENFEILDLENFSIDTSELIMINNSKIIMTILQTVILCFFIKVFVFGMLFILFHSKDFLD